jgi:FemAB-related protein (PEP-CTERM system-associated)
MTHVSILALDDPVACKAWDDFVDTHTQGSVFHRTAWAHAINHAYGHATPYLVAKRGASLVGILPLTLIKSMLFGKALISNAFAVYGGPLGLDAQAHEALDHAAWSLAQKEGIRVLEYRNCRRLRPDWPVKADTYVTFKRALSPDEDANLKAIPRKQRAEVRKSLDKGLNYKIERTLEHHFNVYARSVHRLGTPVFPKKWFAALLACYGADADILTVFEPNGQPAASVLSFYYKGEVLPYYGGGTHAARDLRANDYMYWQLMNHAVARGMTSFDFGRSKIGTGAYHFKKNWGFEAQPLLYEYKLAPEQAMPDLNPNNPKYALLVSAWQRLPLAVANRLGPMLARSLG